MVECIKIYREISHMTYQPKSVGKMEDFETSILFLSLIQVKCVLILARSQLQGLSVPGKNFIPNHHPFSIDFITHTILIWT